MVTTPETFSSAPLFNYCEVAAGRRRFMVMQNRLESQTAGTEPVVSSFDKKRSKRPQMPVELVFVTHPGKIIVLYP